MQHVMKFVTVMSLILEEENEQKYRMMPEEEKKGKKYGTSGAHSSHLTSPQVVGAVWSRNGTIIPIIHRH